jgi:hypothetical protein
MTGHPEVTESSGRRRRACALASVRRPNCTCGFPACSFHEDTGPEMEGKGNLKWALPTSVGLSRASSILGR